MLEVLNALDVDSHRVLRQVDLESSQQATGFVSSVDCEATDAGESTSISSGQTIVVDMHNTNVEFE